jgi:hypothetical protein
MSFQFEVRSCLFPYTDHSAVDQPGQVPQLPDPWRSWFDSARSLATVHWSAAPQLGLPVAPYRVEVAQPPISISHFEGPHLFDLTTTSNEAMPLDSSNNLELPLAKAPADLELGLFYVRAIISCLQPTDVFAVDLTGRELAGSRRPIPTGETHTVFFGPGIYGIGATASVNVLALRVGRIPGEGLEWMLLADVAPSIVGITVYEQQSLLGQSIDALGALGERLLLDAIARQNTTAPLQQTLERKVHRYDRESRARDVLDTSFVNAIASGYESILANPATTFNETLVVFPPGNTIDSQLAPVPLLQFIGTTGPIEAATLGAGVTVPVRDGVPVLAGLYDKMEQSTAPLPFPLIRVTGWFAGPGFVDHHEISANRNDPHAIVAVNYARLMLPQPTPAPNARAVSRASPPTRDMPAHTDVEIAFGREAAAEAVFLVHTIGPSTVSEIANDLPNPFIVVDTDPPDPPDRLSRVVDPELPLPLLADDVASYSVFERDEFGRWNAPVNAACPLVAWPVTVPAMISAEASYGADGIVYLAVTLSWNWTLRTPFEIRMALAIGSDSSDAALGSLAPGDGVTSPLLGQNRAFRLTFDPTTRTAQVDYTPFSPTAPLPVVEHVDPAPPEMAGGPAVFDRSGFEDETYRVTVPLGNAQTLFAARDTRAAAVVADAREVVSGMRRSAPSRMVVETLRDPRAPQLAIRPWQLVWASRPDPGNQARATLVAPQLAGGGAASRFIAWRTHESSVLDLLASSTAASAVAPLLDLVRREEKMSVRLQFLQGLVNQGMTADPAFRGDFLALFDAEDPGVPIAGSAEVPISGAQTGLELFLITATSSNGVESDKSLLANVRAVAVPKRRAASRPSLRIISVDDASLFELTGTCIFLLSANEPFSDADVRLWHDVASDAVHADEILLPFTGFTPIGVVAATAYISDFAALVARQPFANVRAFIGVPPQSWRMQSFTTDLRQRDASQPSDEIASPRAEIVRCFIPPLTQPALAIVSSAKAAGGMSWQLSIVNLPLITRDGLSASEVQLEGEGVVVNASLPQALATPLTLTGARGTIRATFDSTNSVTVSTDFDLGSDSIRVISRDPLGRVGEVTLGANIGEATT